MLSFYCNPGSAPLLMLASPNLLVQLSYLKQYNNLFKKKNELCDLLWWWSLQRGQLRKKRYKIRRKKTLTNPIKLELLSCPLTPIIFTKRYTRSIIFGEVLSKIEKFLNLFGGSLKMSTKYFVTKSENKKLPISLKYVLESFPFTPYIFIKRYTWSINFETIHWQVTGDRWQVTGDRWQSFFNKVLFCCYYPHTFIDPVSPVWEFLYTLK